jgi:phosphotransferase system enzyme I (PtsI)
MFPLVSGVAEIRQAKGFVEQCREELARRGTPVEARVEIGAMIEVPSAAMVAADIAAELDFLSIGTNDLIQYTVAVDRVNPRVAELYRPTHPGVVRLIKTVIDGSSKHGIWTGVCGEMAGDVLYLPLLVGLGVNELSVGAPLVPYVKRAVCSLSHAECAVLAAKALTLAESGEILALCRRAAEAAYPDLLDQLASPARH